MIEKNIYYYYYIIRITITNMEATKKQRISRETSGEIIENEKTTFCCYCSDSTTSNKTFYPGFNSRLHFFLRSIGILQNKLLCCKSCYMEVENQHLEKIWLKEKLTLDYKGYFEEGRHKFSSLNIIGDYCILFDGNFDSINPYIIISISDDHKSFVVNRFSGK